ncbi:tetratricopeptide repeat protein, partial [Streptomyces silvensis]
GPAGPSSGPAGPSPAPAGPSPAPAEPSGIAQLLRRLGSGGRVLITARYAGGWGGEVIDLGVLDLPEAVELFRIRTGGGAAPDAVSLLCEELGCLPLAVTRAATTVTEWGVPLAEYRTHLAHRRSEVLEADAARDEAAREGGGDGAGAGGQDEVTARLRAAVRAVDDPLATRILNALAWFAPAPVPYFVLSGMAKDREVARAVRRLLSHGLLTRDGATLRMRRRVQAVLRAPEAARPPHGAPPGPPPDRAATREARIEATACLAATLPGDADDPANWPRWSQLLPHIEELMRCVPPGEDTEHFASVLAEAAGFVIGQGGTDRGLAMLRRAVEGRRRIFGEQDPRTLAAVERLGTAYRDAGRPEEAAEEYRRTLAVLAGPRERAYGDVLSLRLQLAAAYRESGDAVRAGREFADAHALAAATLGEEDPRTLLARAGVAGSALAAGAPRSAAPLFTDMIEVCVRTLGAAHTFTLAVRGELIAALLAAGEPERAALAAEDAYADCVSLLGAGHADTLRAGERLTEARRASGGPPPDG